MPTSIRSPRVCLGVALLMVLLSCSPAATSPPTPTVTPDHFSASNPCAFTAPPPTPTPGPPTPTPTPFPTSPFSEEDFPPRIPLPPRPTPELPAATTPLTDALVAIAIHPPATNDNSAAQATGLLVSPDGLVLTVLDYTRAVGRIEVVLPDGEVVEPRIERVDARTGATLLDIEGSGLPHARIDGGDPVLSPGEPVFLLSQFPEQEATFVREGFAAPATNEGAQEMLFALLPIWSMGTNGTLVVNREGELLGQAGLGQWWGAGISPHGGIHGSPGATVKTSSLLSLLAGELPPEVPYFPAAVSYHGQGWSSPIDYQATRSLMSGPAEKVLGDLGRPAEVEDLGQSLRYVLHYQPGTVLELVYPRPQELRSRDGELLGQARHVAFWWDREEGRPDMVLCGAEPGRVGAAFLAGDLTELKAAADSASVGEHPMVDFSLLPGYPFEYPLKWQVVPEKDTYRPTEEVEFVVTIENRSDWPMTVHFLPPVLEVRQEGGPWPRVFPWWQSSSGEPGDRSQTVPPHQELRLVIPWAQVDHEGNPMPPGEYTVSAVAPGIRGGKFIILEE